MFFATVEKQCIIFTFGKSHVYCIFALSLNQPPFPLLVCLSVTPESVLHKAPVLSPPPNLLCLPAPVGWLMKSMLVVVKSL